METKGLLNQQTLSRLPEGARLINFARGSIIDDDALLVMLDENHIDHAVLDVFMQEPLPVNHLYWQNASVTVLPHISAPTHPVSASDIVASNIKNFRLTGVIPPAVDPVRGY
jgi:glyoxylate/hydroxypyruvate reductase A